MESISLSINPTYYCNFRCSFCYLSDESLASSLKIKPEALFEKMSEISSVRLIHRVDLYGGEIGLLRPDYFKEIKNVIRIFYKSPISVISNLSVMRDYFLEDDIDLSVSWDFDARQRHEEVYQNMMHLKKPFHILVLASEKLVGMSDQELDLFVQKLNSLPFLETVEIKPYSLNAYHVQNVDFFRFEEFIKRWLRRKNIFRFEFINEDKIIKSLEGRTNSWSDDHLYITPDGEWAVLEFDGQNREYFKKIQNYSDYVLWTEGEKQKVKSNNFCQKCRYIGHCLSEHLQPIESFDSGCNGFKGLLDWYSRSPRSDI